MNTESFKLLAERLAADPDLLARSEHQALSDLLLDLSEGLLDEHTAQEAKAIIESNPQAAAIWRELQESDAYMQSNAGRRWADGVVASVLSSVRPQSMSKGGLAEILQSYCDRLSTWIADTFSSLRLQGAYSDTTAGQRKIFPPSPGDPYEARLVQDRMGRWFLRVVTRDSEAAKMRLRLELEREMPVLEFQPKSDGGFFAEVRLSEAMAEALKSGNRPVFHPVE